MEAAATTVTWCAGMVANAMYGVLSQGLLFQGADVHL
jgi:hypothetical protein